jgi:hypothetical protein
MILGCPKGIFRRSDEKRRNSRYRMVKADKLGMISFDQLKSNSFISSDFDTNKSDIVCVCGWMDGNPRSVKKYAELYSSLGYRILILICTSQDFLLYPTSWVHSNTAKKIKSKLCGDERWIVHLMSNGGCRSWYCLETNLKVNIKSIIFDSAPSKFTIGRKPPYQIFFPKMHWFPRLALLNLIFKPFFNVANLLSFFFPYSHPLEMHQKRYIRDLRRVPKLFLYSTQDLLIPSSDIAEIIDEAKDCGSRVEFRNFVDSAHVAHYQKYPNEYRETVKDFLHK